MKDLFGKAILDYQTHNSPEDLITETSISEADEMSVAYLFRDFKEMPKLEQKALQLAKGKGLDVGCGAGSHALYLQEKGFDVTAIDISENAIKACELRGLKNCKVFVNYCKYFEIQMISFSIKRRLQVRLTIASFIIALFSQLIYHPRCSSELPW